MRNPSIHAQSAMEYLMTYGWAILIIAVVLGVLFQLGVFSASNFTPKVPAGSCQVNREPTTTGTVMSLNGECVGYLPQTVGVFSGQSYFVIPYTNIMGQTKSFTLTMWFKPVAYSGSVSGPVCLSEVLFASQSGYPTSNGIDVGLGNNQCGSVTQDAYSVWIKGAGSESIDVIPQLNEWHFLGLTCNVTTGIVTAYLNASPVPQSLFNYGGCTSFPMVDVQNSLMIGAYSNCPPQCSFSAGFIGDIADVQLYNASLPPEEMASIYTSGIGGPPIEINHLIGWWPLNQNTNDYSGLANDGQDISGIDYSGIWQNGYTTP